MRQEPSFAEREAEEGYRAGANVGLARQQSCRDMNYYLFHHVFFKYQKGISFPRCF